jgi:hypothetical protein
MLRRLAFSCPLLLLALPASAKDLRGRYAVGFNDQFGHVSAISGRYTFPTTSAVVNVQVEGNFGLATSPEEDGKVFTGGRVLYGTIAEDNMNLFIAGGVGALMERGGSTVRLQPGMGADFFLCGLENLGLTIEWGLNLDLADGAQVSTTAAMAAGAHYWF